MNRLVLAASLFGVAAQTIAGDYHHAFTWALVALATIVHMCDERTISELDSDLAAMRASRNAWQENARANTILNHRRNNE